MENEKNTKDTTPAPNSFQKQIGKTTYEVNVYFSQTSKETLEDKLKG